MHLCAGLVVKMKFTRLSLVVTPNINISAKGTGYLMHTNEHIFHKVCLLCWSSNQNEMHPTGFSGDSQCKYFSKRYWVLNAHKRTHLSQSVFILFKERSILCEVIVP